MARNPTTEEEWTVHAINIHGVFFERWCARAIGDADGWRVTKTNYPVEYPAAESGRPQESALDIAAEHVSTRAHLVLLVECKKHSPELSDWVLFPKQRPYSTDRFIVQQVEHVALDDGTWSLERSFRSTVPGIVVADEARETRSSYADYRGGNKTRTSSAAVGDAARQVALATQAIVLDEIEYQPATEADRRPPYERKVFVPAIVTTARLFVCEFDPRDVDAATGEIEFGNVSLSERPHVIYEYPLPPMLQRNRWEHLDDPIGARLEAFVRMHVLIINSTALAEFLPGLPDLLNL